MRLHVSRTQAQETYPAQGGLVHFIYIPSNSNVIRSEEASLLFSCVYKTPVPDHPLTPPPGHLQVFRASYIQNQTPCLLAQIPSPDCSIPLVGHPTNPDSSLFHTPHPTKLTGFTFQKYLDSAVFSPCAVCAKPSSTLNCLILLASQLTSLPFKTKSRLRQFSAFKILHWLKGKAFT